MNQNRTGYKNKYLREYVSDRKISAAEWSQNWRRDFCYLSNSWTSERSELPTILSGKEKAVWEA